MIYIKYISCYSASEWNIWGMTDDYSKERLIASHLDGHDDSYLEPYLRWRPVMDNWMDNVHTTFKIQLITPSELFAHLL